MTISYTDHVTNKDMLKSLAKKDLCVARSHKLNTLVTYQVSCLVITQI